MLAAMRGAKQCAAQSNVRRKAMRGADYFVRTNARNILIYYFESAGHYILPYSRAVHGLFDELKLDIAHRDGVALLYTHLSEFCNHAFFAQNLLEIRH